MNLQIHSLKTFPVIFDKHQLHLTVNVNEEFMQAWCNLMQILSGKNVFFTENPPRFFILLLFSLAEKPRTLFTSKC